MAEKKFGLGTALLIGAAAAAAAGGVLSYIKRAEVRRLAEEIIAKVRPTDTDEVYAADPDGDGQVDAVVAETAEPNIIDSGISLESVENPAGRPEDGAANEAGWQEKDASEAENESRGE